MECRLCKADLEGESPETVIKNIQTLVLDENSGLVDNVNQLELFLITEALKQADGNRVAAAQLLRIPAHRVRYYVEKHGLEKEFPPSRPGVKTKKSDGQIIISS
jgi:transcriptional regulator with GAF, ATPase, and Fis domain